MLLYAWLECPYVSRMCITGLHSQTCTGRCLMSRSMRPADSKITIAPATQARRRNEDCTCWTHQHNANTTLESYKHQIGHVLLDLKSCSKVDKTIGDMKIPYSTSFHKAQETYISNRGKHNRNSFLATKTARVALPWGYIDQWLSFTNTVDITGNYAKMTT